MWIEAIEALDFAQRRKNNDQDHLALTRHYDSLRKEKEKRDEQHRKEKEQRLAQQEKQIERRDDEQREKEKARDRRFSQRRLQREAFNRKLDEVLSTLPVV